MSKIHASLVIELNSGQVQDVHAYTTFEDATDKFKSLVKREEEQYGNFVSDDNIQTMIDDGNYRSELNGYEIALVTTDGVEVEIEREDVDETEIMTVACKTCFENVDIRKTETYSFTCPNCGEEVTNI